jgi:hypothetical protein
VLTRVSPLRSQLFAISLYRLFLHPLRRIPGPVAAKLSGLYGAFYARESRLHKKTWEDHRKYGEMQCTICRACISTYGMQIVREG